MLVSAVALCLFFAAKDISQVQTQRELDFPQQLQGLRNTEETQQPQQQPQQQQPNTTAQQPQQRRPPQNEQPKSICGYFQQSPSPMALWAQHLGDIFKGSRMPLDRSFALHDVTAYVLQLMTPRLALGQRSLPLQRSAVQRVLDKWQKRWDFLEQQDEDTSSNKHEDVPKIRILVLGGSVTMGVNCFTGIRRYDYGKCAWPARLEHLINTLAGNNKDMVEVVNLAVGGSNTATGTALMEYDLVPPHARHPDILINAYSTNDMHILTMKDAANNNMTLRDKTFAMAQDFARIVMGQCPEKKRPLLLWLDDYLGNEQRGILETTELSQGLQVLANYYGFGFVSYADTVRDWVYGTTNETTFSPAGWYVKGKPGMSREIHPGASTHIAISYVVAYYLLQMVSTTCNTPWTEFDGTHYVGGHGLPELKHNNNNKRGPLVAEHPRPTPKALRPPLEPQLQLDNVSQLWKDAKPCPANSTTNDDNDVRCPVSWVSGISKDSSKPDEVLKTLEPYLVQPLGWELRDDRKVKKASKKFGFSPPLNATTTRRTTTMTLQFHLDRDVSTLAVFFLKSYGDKWENSTATVEIVQSSSKDVVVASHVLHGFHDKKTSENYSGKVEFPQPLRDFQVRLVHTAGSTFKLMGFAVCS